MPRQTHATTPGVVALTRDLRQGKPPIAELVTVDASVAVIQGRDDIWAVIRRARGSGGIALRLMSCPGSCETVSVRQSGTDSRTADVRVSSAAGRHHTRVEIDLLPLPVIKWRTTMKPNKPIRMPVRDRDLYVLGPRDDPRWAHGRVEAAQRGLNTAVLFLTAEEPPIGHALYVQDLTALNDFFSQSGSLPDGVVGGEWPELGMLASAAMQGGQREAQALAAGADIVVSQGAICLSPPTAPDDTQQLALAFLQSLASVYPHLEKDPPVLRDWPGLAEQTVRDLPTPGLATEFRDRHPYVRPYVDAEYPDVMVQVAIAAELRNYEAWADERSGFTTRLIKAIADFYDPSLKTLRRYLPGWSEGKDADAVDSWYLYHPLVNLERLSAGGDETAKQLFLDSLDYAIEVARHFEYHWPIQYKIDDWSVITPARDGSDLGQTDVNGIYAYVMLGAFEMTDDMGFVEEAIKAIDATVKMRFELNYQANLTAFGAAACVRLWRITGEERHLRQSYVYLASFMHNTQMWKSRLGNASDTHTFFSATCLHDAPYTAPFETYDSYLAFEQVLRHGGSGLDPAIRLLLSEFCAYALDGTWLAFPQHVKPELLANGCRNGHIDRTLAFPLEDLYADGQPAGQVGQEIYGAGAALAFTARAFAKHPSAPFIVHSDRRISHSHTESAGIWSIELDAPPTVTARLAVMARSNKPLPRLKVTSDGRVVRAIRRSPNSVEYLVRGGASLLIAWSS